MRLFVKFMLFVATAAIAAPFFIAGRDGRPLMSLDRLHVPHASLPNIGDAAETEEQTAKPIEVFKWQDEGGVWHFSDRREQGQSARTVTIDPNAGVVHWAAIENPAANDGSRDSSEPDAPAAASFGKISELIGASKKMGRPRQESIDQRERAAQD